jgi:MFS superfamily sulfate permease-like transporter
MKNNSLASLSNSELMKKYDTLRTIQWVVIAVFTVILLGWVFLGYWDENLPVFIIQVVIAFVIIFLMQIPLIKYRKEIVNRSSVASDKG